MVLEQGVSGCSSARSSLEEPFGRRGVQRFLKITPEQDRNNKLLSSSAGLEAGPRQLLPGRRRPLGCAVQLDPEGGTGVPHTGQGASVGYRWHREMLMLRLKVGRKGRICSWEGP